MCPHADLRKPAEHPDRDVLSKRTADTICTPGRRSVGYLQTNLALQGVRDPNTLHFIGRTQMDINKNMARTALFSLKEVVLDVLCQAQDEEHLQPRDISRCLGIPKASSAEHSYG